jgi:hypothetical protein
MVPLWSHDGKTIIFASNPVSTPDIYRRPIESTDDASLVIEDPRTLVPSSVSPDGEFLLYHRIDGDTARDLWVKPSEEPPYPFLQTRFDETYPTLSPDGRWVAYLSDSSGETRVYLQPFPGGGAVTQVSAGPGTEPVWARDGEEIFYRDGLDVLGVGVDIGPGDAIAVGTPEVLFSADYLLDNLGVGVPNYDVSIDGKSFLMPTLRGSAALPVIVLVDNWFQELKRLVPVD